MERRAMEERAMMDKNDTMFEQFKDLRKEASDYIVKDSRLPRDRYPEYDGTKDSLKRMGAYDIAGAGIGAGIGALKGGKRGAAVGALFGIQGGTLAGVTHQAIRDTKSSKVRYADDPKTRRDAILGGPAYAEYGLAKREARADNKAISNQKIASVLADSIASNDIKNLSGRVGKNHYLYEHY